MTQFTITYELDNGEKTISGNNDGDFANEQEARQATEDFLGSIYDSDDGWMLHSLEVTEA